MVTVDSFTDHSRGNQLFTLKIPFNLLLELDLDQKQKDLIFTANHGEAGTLLMINILRMLLDKVEERPDLLEGENNG